MHRIAKMKIALHASVFPFRTVNGVFQMCLNKDLDSVVLFSKEVLENETFEETASKGALSELGLTGRITGVIDGERTIHRTEGKETLIYTKIYGFEVHSEESTGDFFHWLSVEEALSYYDKWMKPVFDNIYLKCGNPAKAVRYQSGVVPLIVTNDDTFVCLIRYKNAEKDAEWGLPRGGIEPDLTAAKSALKEAFEEAGLIGDVVDELGTSEYEYEGVPQHVTWFSMRIDKTLSAYPEVLVRDRRWIALEKAFTMVHPVVAAKIRKAAQGIGAI